MKPRRPAAGKGLDARVLYAAGDGTNKVGRGLSARRQLSAGAAEVPNHAPTLRMLKELDDAETGRRAGGAHGSAAEEPVRTAVPVTEAGGVELFDLLALIDLVA